MLHLLEKQAEAQYRLVEEINVIGEMTVHIDDITDIIVSCVACGIEVTVTPLNKFEALICKRENCRVAV